MVVYEVKNPQPAPVYTGKPDERKAEPVDALSPPARIGRFRKVWRRYRQRATSRRKKVLLSPAAERDVRSLIDTVNSHLDRNNIQIHLVLMQDEKGYALDVYDCTDNQVCRIVRDIVIDLDELPVLLGNLQEETGLLVDIVS